MPSRCFFAGDWANILPTAGIADNAFPVHAKTEIITMAFGILVAGHILRYQRALAGQVEQDWAFFMSDQQYEYLRHLLQCAVFILNTDESLWPVAKLLLITPFPFDQGRTYRLRVQRCASI